MHMRMMLEVLAPRVEDGQETDLSPEVLGIGGDSTVTIRRRLGTEGRRPPVVDSEARSDRAARKRKNYMKVLDRQEVCFPFFHPLCRGGGLALGAVSVAARVVGYPLMPALIAGLDVTTQRRGPTDGDVLEGGGCSDERAAVPLEESFTVLSEDLGHFEPRPGPWLWPSFRWSLEPIEAGFVWPEEIPPRHGYRRPLS